MVFEKVEPSQLANIGIIKIFAIILKLQNLPAYTSINYLLKGIAEGVIGG